MPVSARPICLDGDSDALRSVCVARQFPARRRLGLMRQPRLKATAPLSRLVGSSGRLHFAVQRLVRSASRRDAASNSPVGWRRLGRSPAGAERAASGGPGCTLCPADGYGVTPLPRHPRWSTGDGLAATSADDACGAPGWRGTCDWSRRCSPSRRGCVAAASPHRASRRHRRRRARRSTSGGGGRGAR